MGDLMVVALGGNSLIEDSHHVSVPAQYEACRRTAAHLAGLIQEGHRVVVVHGNGPQVGFILRRAELARMELHPVPLDSCVADTQGAIGYNLQMALRNELNRLGEEVPVSTVVTQVEVDPEDPSFQDPSKPIGSFMGREAALIHRQKDGWDVREDAGRGYRRVVPSPQPREILELPAVSALLEAGQVVIAAGGGGIPVVWNAAGELEGREAVIDKDRAASLLARQLGADRFVISTAVDQVCLNFGRPGEKPLSRLSLDEARRYVQEGHFGAGSMGPKIEAMIDYVSATGRPGLITSPGGMGKALKGEGGTEICFS